MLDFVKLTHPGPFLPRTIDLGKYWSIQQDHQIAAMAGERFHLARYRENSAVCTHPYFRRRGYAKHLIGALVNETLRTSKVSFLHVMRDNSSAIALYESMGFTQRAEFTLNAHDSKVLPDQPQLFIDNTCET